MSDSHVMVSTQVVDTNGANAKGAAIRDVVVTVDVFGTSEPTKVLVYKRIYQTAVAKEKLIYLCGIICSTGSGTILPLMTLIFGNFVTIFTRFATGAITSADFNSKINYYTLYFVYLFLARLGLTYISQVIFAVVSTRVTARLRELYLRSMLEHSVAFHETTSSSGAVSLALSSHCGNIQSGLSDKFGLSVQCISTVISAFAVAFASQWKLTLVTATIIPATVLGVGITSVFDSKLEEELNATKSEAATIAEEVLSSIRTALVLGALGKLLSKYQSYLTKASGVGRKRAPIFGIQTGIYMFMNCAAYALAFWYGVHLYADGEAKSSGSVITTLFSILIGTNAFAQLAGYVGALLRISSAGIELLKVIDFKSPTTTNNSEGSIIETPTLKMNEVGDTTVTNNVTFANVTFSYPLRPAIPVLREFSLRIRAGKMTALIGPSGSGKSTVVGLLERWYSVDKGMIELGQTDITNLPMGIIRGKIGLVQQEPQLFSTTIFENVLYGIPQETVATLSEDEKRKLVIDACKLVNAHDFIQDLPKGYETFVGNKATMLSGGQKQRLAIARAVIGNPQILILDEATSALDPASEKIVEEALDRAAANRTTIAIAHRLSTIRHADTIVVLNHGSIVEQGSHEELLAKPDGTYKKLLAAQTLIYEEKQILEELPEVNTIEPGTQVEILRLLSLGASMSAKNVSLDVASNMGTLKTLYVSLYEQRSHWLKFMILFICCTIGGVYFPLQSYFYSQVVSAFQFKGSELTSQGDFLALMFFVLAIVVGIAYLWIASLGEYLGKTISQFYRFSYFSGMVKQPVAFFDDSANSSGSLTSRLATDPDAIKSLAGPNIGVITVVGVSILSTTILSLAVGWKLALVAIFGALPFIFFAGLVHESMEHRFEETVAETFPISVGYASECIQAIRTVKAFNIEGRIESSFAALLRGHCVKAQKHAMKSMIWFAFSESIDLLCMGLTFWYGGHLLASHEYTTGQFYIVFVAIVISAQSLGQFFAHGLDIMKGRDAYNAVRSLKLSIPNDIGVNESIKDVENSSSLLPLIEFRRARFTYPARPTLPILRGLDLKLEKGQFIALVDPSGSRKSTVLSLLERFYDVNSGEVLFHNMNVSTFPKDEMRNKLALVSQEPVLYQDTIRENILLGSTSELSDAELDHIAKQAQIFDLIQSLPEGYNTQVGSRGTALSGGQKQRIVIARAIPMNKKILLLDEATSALDSESEALVHEALKEAGKDRSIIAVAHRLSTIQHADVIYVLRDGKAGECGTHAELLERKGIYFHMCVSQGLSLE